MPRSRNNENAGAVSNQNNKHRPGHKSSASLGVESRRVFGREIRNVARDSMEGDTKRCREPVNQLAHQLQWLDLEGDQITAAVTQADLSCQPAVLTTSLEDQSQKQRKESSGGTSDFACPFCGNHTSWADCKCLNYSRVFNARNSFASIAQQSTPLAQVQHCNNNHKNVTFVETSEDFDSQLFFTPLRSSTSARDCDAALDNSQKEGAGLMLDKANEDDCGSQAMSQLATQLSECVLSPCVKLKESSILASDSKRSLTESLSLGYIPTAFPEDSS